MPRIPMFSGRTLQAATLTAATVMSVALAACGSSASSSSTGASATAASPSGGAKAAKIAIRNYAYSPPTVTVAAGAKLTFTNLDKTAHTATSQSGGLDTGTVDPGKSATVTVKKPGTYSYICLFHAFMHGAIVVK